MKHQVPGFTLVELIVGLLISSMLAMILFGTYMQSQRAIQRTNEVVNRDFQLMVLYNQFARDITGMFVPHTFEKKEQPSKQQRTVVDQQTPAKQQPQPKAQQASKLKRVAIKQPLVVQRNEKNVQMVSFVTNNPLNVYGRNGARMVRMAYYLEPDEQRPELYKLYRAESPTVDYEQFKEEQPYRYLLARSIKEFSLDFYAVKKDEPKQEVEGDQGKKPGKQDKKEQKPTDKPDEPQPPKILEFLQLTDWNQEELAENDELVPDLLPHTLRVKVNIVDDDELVHEHSFFFRVWAYMSGIVPQPQRPQPRGLPGSAQSPSAAGQQGSGMTGAARSTKGQPPAGTAQPPPGPGGAQPPSAAGQQGPAGEQPASPPGGPRAPQVPR